MLGRLHMSLDEAIEAFYLVTVTAFPEKKWSAKDSRTKELEKAITGLVDKHTRKENSRMVDIHDHGSGCKTFVCVASGYNLGDIERLRTYLGAKNQAPNYTIVEALLATTAIRGIFEPRVLQESTGLSSSYVAADHVCGNPVALMLNEAQEIFPEQHIACIISLGSGHPRVASILGSGSNPVKDPEKLVIILERIAKDCEREAENMYLRFQRVDDFYFRLNVEQGMQSICESDYKQASAIQAHTRAFISKLDATKLDRAARAVIERKESVATSNLTGIVYSSFGQCRIQPCPPPSPNFTGRAEVLGKMLEYFTKPSEVQHSFVLYGLGGSGKTQIARMFIKNHKNLFSEVYPVDATSAQTIELDFKNIARAKNAGETLEDAFYWLRTNESNWIILYDNADDTQLDLRRYFPDCPHGNLLITTRNKNFVVYARGPRSDDAVSGLSPGDAVDLLLKVSKRETDEPARIQASEIVEELGFHALAITQAGAYILVQDYRIDEYLVECRRVDRLLGKCMPADIPTDHDYRRGIYATWMLSYEKLTHNAVQLLHFLAFMHHTGITEDIFRVAHAQLRSQHHVSDDWLTLFLSRFEGPDKSSITLTWDSLTFRDALNEPRSYSLVDYNRQTGIYSIHPLVHKWIQKLAPGTIVNSVAMLLALCVNEQRQLTDYAFRRTLLPHIDALPEGRRADPTVAAQFSVVYREAGRWSEAEGLEKIVLNDRKQRLGDEHPETLASMHYLGSVYREQGRWEEAEHTLEIVVAARNRLLGENSAETLESAHQLVQVYLEQSNWELARVLEEKILEVRRRITGENDPETIECMAHLAWAYWGLNRLSEAEALEGQVVEANTRLFTRNHPRTLRSIHNLAATYRKQGQLNKAEVLNDEVLSSRSQLLGRYHPHTLLTMCNLGGIYIKQGRLPEAERILKEVVEARSKVLCEHHPHTLLAMQDLAVAYVDQKRWEEAVGLMTRVANEQKALGLEDRADSLLVLNNLALIYGHQENWPKARELMRQVVEKRKKRLGDNHPDTLASIQQLAEWEPRPLYQLGIGSFIWLSILISVVSCLFYFIVSPVPFS
ncbi:hypothetical protein FRC10_005644 [Ceratobasidium sp. 414]|nr:hypothetical protein FRC10_005644 [Ceratobasidium sp. 414]